MYSPRRSEPTITSASSQCRAMATGCSVLVSARGVGRAGHACSPQCAGPAPAAFKPFDAGLQKTLNGMDIVERRAASAVPKPAGVAGNSRGAARSPASPARRRPSSCRRRPAPAPRPPAAARSRRPRRPGCCGSRPAAAPGRDVQPFALQAFGDVAVQAQHAARRAPRASGRGQAGFFPAFAHQRLERRLAVGTPPPTRLSSSRGRWAWSSERWAIHRWLGRPPRRPRSRCSARQASGCPRSVTRRARCGPAGAASRSNTG